MSAIFGLLSRDGRGRAQTTTARVSAMGRLHSGAPDQVSIWADEDFGIAFGCVSERSGPTGSAATHRPIESSDGRFVLVVDGEVFDDGGVGASREALLDAIVTRGLTEVLRVIDGAFVLALWDRVERTLTLARDRMGIRPLNYGTLSNGDFVFASSLDMIAADSNFDRPLDLDALTLFFRHKYIPTPWTIYRGIHKLEAAATVTIDSDGRVSEPQPYWSFFDLVTRGAVFTGSANDAVDELDHLLRSSVGRRFDGSGQTGVLLSGGVDSSTTASVAKEIAGESIDTFTIGWSDSALDESGAARRIAEHLGTRHHELIVTKDDVLRTVERLGQTYYEPFADSSQVPSMLAAELAGRDVNAVLCGDGGDEVFLGYNRYVWVPAIWRRLSKLPNGLRRSAAGALGRVPPGTWDRMSVVIPDVRRPRQLGLKVTKVLAVADSATPQEVFHRLVSHWTDPSRLVIGGSEPPTLHTNPEMWPDVEGIVEYMSAIDTVGYLSDDGGTKVANAAASAGISPRFPMLDRDVVEFASTLPTEMKLSGGTTKIPLRGVLSRYVPPAISQQPKTGFGWSIDEWLRGALRPWAEHHLFETGMDSVLDREIVTTAWQNHLTKRSDESFRLWDVIMFSVWCEHRGVVP